MKAQELGEILESLGVPAAPAVVDSSIAVAATSLLRIDFSFPSNELTRALRRAPGVIPAMKRLLCTAGK